MSGDTLQDVSVNISDVTQRRIKVRPTLLQDVYYYYTTTTTTTPLPLAA